MKANAHGKKGLIHFLVFVGLILYYICNPVIAYAQDTDTLKISALPFMSYAPIYIAYEEGYFSEQKLDLKFVRFKEVGQSIPALARGDIDVAADSIGANLFSAVYRGLNIKVVADKGHFGDGCWVSAIMVRKQLYDSGEVRTVSQLKGRKVALALVPIFGYVYEKILSEGNLTLDDIEIVTMPVPARVIALESGAIDAAGVTEPMVTKIESLGIGVKLARYGDYAPRYQASTIIFGPNLLEKNPQVGKRFMVAYLKGIRQFQKGKTERNIEILHKYMKLEPEILKKICYISFYADGHVNIESVREVQDWAYKRGFIDGKV